MRTLWAVLGTLLVVVSVGGLALLAASPPGEAPTEPAPAAARPRPAGSPPTERASTTTEPLPTRLAGQPTQTTAASERASTVSASASSFPVMFDDRFTDNRMAWPSDPQASAWFGDGGYRLFAREPNRFVAIGAPLVRPFRDVILSANFRKVGGPPGGGYGLIVRDQGPDARDGRNQGGRYYVLEVGDRGEIGMWRREQDQWVELLPWTPSEAVHPGGAPNEVEVWAIGERLTLLVNGVQAASQTDAALPVGNVGIFVGGDSNQVALDRLVVRAPSDQGSGSPAAGAPPELLAAAPTPRPFLPITRVTIPSIALDAPAVPAQLVDRQGGLTWDVPPFTIGHAQDTAGAGDPGNAVLVGHVTSRSLGNVFENLHEVRVGQPVQVFSGEQRFDYEVTEVRTVARTDVSVVRPTGTPSITLITCTGLWLPVISDYSERVVVRAEQVPGGGS